jgi:PIN domain nuclease of toxin-antitoxin system
MTLLLDTHAFLWFVSGDTRLSKAARRAMEADGAELHVSAASVWELAIKLSLGRLTLPVPLGDYMADKVAMGFRVLSVRSSHAAAVAAMPFHHRDPFDRLLAAQALAEKMAFVTVDPIFRAYGVRVVW